MIKKVNLGCGPIGKDDWINIDWGILAILHKFAFLEQLLIRFSLFPSGYNVRWPRNLKLHNCKKKLPFKDSSVDYIVTSHFLEHFKKFETERIVQECFRILKNEGMIRIAVPNLEILADKYLKRDEDFFKKVFGLMNFSNTNLNSDLQFADMFMDNFYPSCYKIKQKGFSKILSFFVRAHFWMYDFESLKAMLKASGFVAVEKRSFRERKVPDLEILDVFPDTTLYVEAKKWIQ